ncbi:hypothetical protein J437_LFUL000544 [Ladona fulva]|uniref:Uncharacterized protein n=1 Tax=Ladona fulva TaxID=123851 RepID=A0A8K0JZG8_LADFU|nr:hypothetical protein J437_LFUL000544 [Ladona fulva]
MSQCQDLGGAEANHEANKENNPEISRKEVLSDGKGHLRMTLKERGCVENERKDIYCIKGDVNMFKEKIRRKFISSDKSETLHFGDVGREEILLRKLLDHNKSKKAFIEDHLTKMKQLIQRIIMLEKENENCTSVAQENKHLKQEVKYWRNHALKLRKISSYPTKMDSYIQELERRVYMLKEELLESFKREYKLKKVVNSLNLKEPNDRFTDSDDTFLKGIMEERKALGKQKESMKRLMNGSDEILNIDKSDEQVSPSKKREYRAKRNFPGKRSQVFSEGNISMIKENIFDDKSLLASILQYENELQWAEQETDNRDMRISKENIIQTLINEDEEKIIPPSYKQQKSQKISQKYITAEEVTDEEMLAEEDSDEDELDEWYEHELEEQRIPQKGSKFQEAKMRENFPLLETSTSRKESHPLEQGNVQSKNEGRSRDTDGILEDYRKSQTLMGRKVTDKGAIALQEDDKQLICRTIPLRESTDAAAEEMFVLQGRSTSGEIAFEERTAMTKDNKLVSEKRETKDSYLPSGSVESPPIKVKYRMGKGTEEKDTSNHSSVERVPASIERQKEFKAADIKDNETFLAEKGAEFPDKNIERKPKAKELSLPLQEIGSLSNHRKLRKEGFLPQKAQQAKTVSNKIEVPQEEIGSEVKEREYEVKERQVFSEDTTSQSRGITFEEEKILSDDAKAPSKNIKIIFKEKEALPENTQVKEKDFALKDKKVIHEDAATQSKVNGIMQAFSGKTISHAKEREMVSKEVQAIPEDTATLSKEGQTMLKEIQAHPQDTAAQSIERETIFREPKVLPKNTIGQAKERENIQSSSEDSAIQSTDRRTMFNQMQDITEDAATQSKEREIMLEEVQTHDSDETQFKGRNLLIEEMQAHPKKTVTPSKEREVAMKESKFNKKSITQEKDFQLKENAQKSKEITSLDKKAEEKFEMIKRERELMLKDAIAGGKIDLRALGTIPVKSDRERWPRIMNRYEMENKQVEDKSEMLRDVKEHKENHFTFRENMIIPSSKESVRIPVKETQPLGMDRNCRCKKQNYFLEQVLNVQETTEKRNNKEDGIRTEISKITSLKYKREAITLGRQPCQQIVNNMIHDLIHKTERKGWEQKVSYTSKIYQEDEAGIKENIFDDNSLLASILKYENELQGAERETDQLINIVHHLLEALGTSFKLLKEDNMNEEMN